MSKTVLRLLSRKSRSMRKKYFSDMLGFIEMKFTEYNTKHFKVHNSVAFGTFSVVQSSLLSSSKIFSSLP